MYIRYFLEIAYKGTNFHGWQTQPNAITVQEILNKSLSALLKDNIVTLGCGRTDAGVHAKQFFVHFDTLVQDLHLNKESFLFKINAMMDFDIAVKNIIKIHENAHARYDAIMRTYNYKIHFLKNPFLNHFSWQRKDNLDLELMQEATKMLIGIKDFGCFSKSNTDVKTNICNVTSAYWERNVDGIEFTISANRFLRNMVRAIVGTMVDIGNKKIDLQDLENLIESKNRSEAGMSVPAQGLYLIEVKYPYILN